MQKKILASLLVTPLAFNAVADITINGNLVDEGKAWTQTGVSGTNVFQDGKVICPMASGVLKKFLDIPAKGTYEIRFTNKDNIKVSVDGQELEANGDSYSFKVDGEKTVELQISSDDKINDFGFEGAQLVLVFDFEATATALNTSLDGVTLKEVKADDTSKEAVDIREQAKELEADKKNIANNIAKLSGETAIQIDVYADFHLWAFADGKDKISQAIEDLKYQVQKYNGKVDTENATYQTIQANTAAKQELLNKVNELSTALETVESGINDGKIQYVIDKNSPAIEEIKATIKGFKTAIETAYADPSKTDIQVDDQTEAINTAIEGLKTAAAADTDDWNAYTAIMTARGEIAAAKDKAAKDIDALKGVEGKENTFDTYKATQIEKVNNLYNDAIAAVPAVVEGASKVDATILATNTNAIAKIAEDAKTYVDGQNALYTAGTEAVDGKQTALGDIKIPDLPTDAADTEAAGLQKEAQDAIDALTEKINADYAAGTLAEGAYDADLAAIDAKIQAVSDYLAPWAPVMKLQTELDGLMENINKYQTYSTIESTEFNLMDKFSDTADSTIETIQNSIKALYDKIGKGETVSESEVENVRKAISDTDANAKELIDAYAKASKAVGTFTGLKEQLDGTEKDCFGAYTKDTFLASDTYKAFAKAYTDFNDDLKNAANSTAQECFATATKLSADIEAYDVEAKYQTALKVFETNGSEGNYTKVETALTAAREALEDEFYGKEEVTDTVTGLEAKLAELRVSLDAAIALEEADTKAFDTVDAALKALNDNVTAASDEVKSLKANQKAYDELVAAFSPAVENALAHADDYNTKNSLPPALDFFKNQKIAYGVADAAAETLQGKANALLTDIEKALTNKTAANEKGDLNTRVGALITAIGDIEKAIKENTATYNGQLVKSNEVASSIKTIKEDLAAADTAAGSTLTVDWQTILTNLQNDSLPEVDNAAFNAYGTGESFAQNDALIQRYNDILAHADSVKVAFEEQFGQRITGTNAQTIKDCGWKSVRNEMMTEYNNAIAQYNAFFTLSNANYRNYILKVVQSNEIIFQYYEKIRQLEADVTAWVTGKNSAKKVFTKEDFEEEANAKAGELIGEIQQKVKDMFSQTNAAAETYYTSLHAEKAKYIDDQTQKLTDAGVTGDILAQATKSANDFMATAEDRHSADVAKEDFSLTPMDDIANNLESINIDTAKAAKEQWDADYAADKAQLDQYTKDLPGFVDEGDPTIATLAGYVAEAEALNTTASNDANLLGNLKAHNTALDEILANATALFDKAKGDFEANAENTALAGVYADQIANLRDRLKKLMAYADGLTGGAIDTSDIENKITTVENKVETYKASLAAHKSEIDGYAKAASTAIDNGYETSKNNEMVALNQLLVNTKEAFNNLSTYGENIPADKLNEYNETINGHATTIAGLNDPKIFDNDEDFAAKARDLETELSNLYAKINSQYSHETEEGNLGGDPLTPILERLNAKYDQVEAAITAGTAALDECYENVKREYAPKYGELTAKLAAVKAAYEAEGNKLVINSAEYEAKLADIQTEAGTLAGEVRKANEAAKAQQDIIEANEKAYKKLTDQLNTLSGEADSAKDLAVEYGVDEILDNYILSLDYLIENADQWLTTEYDNVNLTDNSTLPYEYDIKYYIGYVKSEAVWRNSYYNKSNETNTALREANKALGASVVPEIKKEQRDEYNTAYTRFNKLRTELNTVRQSYNDREITLDEFVDTINAINKEFDAIKLAAENIKAEAEANVFTPGDVNDEPDGEVNVTDLQTLIAWIGEGITYEGLYELSPRQAAAADITGNRQLNIGDATSLVQLIMDNEAPARQAAPRRLMPRRAVADASAHYALALTSNENGTRTYALTLNNSDAFIGAQIDVKLPSGMTLTDARMESRGASHEVTFFDNGNGEYRLVVISMENAAFAGTEGAILTLTTEGIGNPEVTEMLLADPGMNTVRARKADTSMIDTIMMNATNVKDTIYNVAGQTMRALRRGVNIIRHSDGTTTKELH